MTQNEYSAFINGVDIADFGALVESYVIGGVPFNNTIYQGRNRTSFQELSYQIGLRPITLNLFFAAASQHELAMHKSQLDAQMVGKFEIRLPDGFLYSCIVEEIGAVQMLGQEGNQMIAQSAYTLQGIRHDPLRTVTGNTILAEGTAPRMDARLKCVTTAARATLQMGPVTFASVPKGATVIADGIDGVLTVNGVNVIPSFESLPYVVPGRQTITCPETLTIEYYPVWI